MTALPISNYKSENSCSIVLWGWHWLSLIFCISFHNTCSKVTIQQNVRTGKDHTGWRALTIWWLPAKEDTLQNNCPMGPGPLGLRNTTHTLWLHSLFPLSILWGSHVMMLPNGHLHISRLMTHLFTYLLLYLALGHQAVPTDLIGLSLENTGNASIWWYAIKFATLGHPDYLLTFLNLHNVP